jgi:hypothetical protein
MRWNWGTKLIIVFGFFVLGMIALVGMSMRQKVELVSKDYYSEELRYQQVMDATQRAQALKRPLVVEQRGNQVLLRLPQEAGNGAITGQVYFYCAADGQKDKRLQLQTNANGEQSIPIQQLRPGRYTVKVDWQYGGQAYYAEREMDVE